ncbi:Protein of unknown function [Leifsonia sp. 98AMF]|uniref:DUF3043 domain-containing protein n=1 Tax=unclassified Leifsonia TaxID=2663824 RepID=UPI0008794E49|nr:MULTISPECIES: DUF3043 domain-containing protein [unclassified Leifsonia]SDH42625.1 Protein of unknown function [Leifsonia sp. 197AMF]SDI94389.1 Protein of unknown function [Leifsonia sp. 466MF]SDJ83164.1 Protein of unknown function [Leifsonia sp. 157MF]SDN98076.1 Protein of unknown function [Leifsonia sp. 509MF]SEN07054.1 Protein of unknown function [Leifsonia sp. 467MF]
MAKRQNAASEAETPVAETPEETAARLKQGKGAPTPSRRQQEAARKRPLVPTDRKEAARVARQKQAEAREKARIGMAAGDDRYLTARDRGPQRRYVRDYVDARFSIGEFLIPVMLIVIILTFLPWPEMQVYGLFALWGFFLIAVIDCFVLGFLVRKRIGAKFGATKVERGLRWYAAMRALQLRVMRLPKPQVKRGQFPS